MDIFILLSQFVVGLSIIVGIHELGHLLWAKLFGMKVESYGIGMPPKIFKFTWRGTEYYLGALPFGGAVKIAGMVDENMYNENSDSIESIPEVWEFRGKPAWQRMLVWTGGIAFNFILAVIIYAALFWHTGYTYISREEVNKNGIAPSALAIELGFKEGDKILRIMGEDFKNFDEVMNPKYLLSNNLYYTIERDGLEQKIFIDTADLNKILEGMKQETFLSPCIDFYVRGIVPGSEAERIGLLPEDKIVGLAGSPIKYYHNLKSTLAKNLNKDVELIYIRGSETMSVIAHIDMLGNLGIEIVQKIKYSQERYNMGKCVAEGVKRVYSVVELNIIALKKLISGKISASKSLSGPIAIAQIFGKKFDIMNFWNIVAFLSTVIAFTNLLPVPALDGGHVMLIIFELVTRRRLSSAALLRIQKLGIGILLALLAYTTVNDLLKTFLSV